MSDRLLTVVMCTAFAAFLLGMGYFTYQTFQVVERTNARLDRILEHRTNP
jgi:hypothetical protein